ncbi:uncharacterized protein [Montipora foliosa]|uniref:uncharacterized protein isoform X1 n=1 Tax=Montipora foliosa TaxID=591990 RepID=UPI0035F1C174
MPIPGVTVEDVDAYSDVSNGSTISVGSAASGGSGHMPRPPTGGSRRSKSVQGRRSRVATSPYSSSQMKVSTKQRAPKPSARNMWIASMRNGAATLSTENSPMRTFAGSRASNSKHLKTGTRTQHLSDFVVIDNLKNKNHVRSASMSASEPHLAGGGPAYKPQEDYYDEVIELKKVINTLKAENNIISTKLRRVEGENVLKDRKMEDLLNQRKQPEDVRRTLTDKKGDTSAIVNSLKQKLHAVERTVKDKEAELSQLRKTIKMTNIEELQIQSETYYQEVQRLQLVVLEMQQAQGYDHYGKTSSTWRSPSPREQKGKPSTLTLKRLEEENDHLKAENRSLKKDLLSAIENSTSDKSKVPMKAEYADMNRGQLLAKIHELEEKIQDSDGKKPQPRKGSMYEDKEEDEKVRRRSSSISKLAEVPGRIQLKGSASQKLVQLQEREVELLEERQKQREAIERLKEDRAHYRLVADDLRMQLQSTQDELNRLLSERSSEGDKRRSSAASLTSPRRMSVKESPPPLDGDDNMDRMLKEFQQQRAAKTLQRQWRGFQGRKQRIRQEEEEQEQQQRVRKEEDRQNQAAATLQKNWRRHRERAKQTEGKAREEAITEIQAALRGQAVRRKHLEQLDKELEMTDRDDAIIAIQSAMRAHLARKKHTEQPDYELVSRDSRTRGSSSHPLLGSEPDTGDELVSRSTRSRMHQDPTVTGLRRSSLSESLAPAPLKRDKTRVPKALPRSKARTRDLDSSLVEARDSVVVVAEDAKSNPSSDAPARDKESARDQSPPDLDKALNVSVVAHDDTNVGNEFACDPSALARGPSDSDDDAVVIGGSTRSRTKQQSNVKTALSSTEPGDDRQNTLEVNKDSPITSTKKSRSKKTSAKKKSRKNKTEDYVDYSSKEEGARPRLISPPRFSNIPERSEDEEASFQRSKSNQSLFDEFPTVSAGNEAEQRAKRKTFEIVDSDDDDDNVVVLPSRRTLDTGIRKQRPSLSSSTRAASSLGEIDDEVRPGLSRSTYGIGSTNRENEQRLKTRNVEIGDSDDDDDDDDAVVLPSRRVRDTGVSQPRLSLSTSTLATSSPSRSEDKVRPGLSRPVHETSSAEGEVLSMKNRPGLSRATGKLAARGNIENSELDIGKGVQKPGLSKSKRPMSARRPNGDRNDGPSDEGSKGVTGWRQSDAPARSEDDSDDENVVVTGRKTKTASGGGKTRARPSLARKSPAFTLAAPSQRETLSSSLDNFFSSAASSAADANSKKSLRRTAARVNESDNDINDDDDDEDEDDDDLVVSSRSKHKSRRKEAPRKDSRDSVADLWATSEKKSTSNKGKSSAKTSKKNTWSSDFEFEKPPRRPESALDELF